MKKKFFFLAAAWAIILALVWQSSFLKIKDLKVEIKNAACVEEKQLRVDSQLLGKNLLFISTQILEQELLNKYPCVTAINFAKVFPNKIYLRVVGRENYLALAPLASKSLYSLSLQEATPSSSSALLDFSFPQKPEKTFLADQTGFIFSQNKDNSLPLLFLAEDNLKIGSQIEKNLFAKIVSVLEKIKSLPLESNRILAKEAEGNLIINSKPKIVFNLNKDLTFQLASLQLLLQESTINERKMSIIDLRFAKPIVIYSSKP